MEILAGEVVELSGSGEKISGFGKELVELSGFDEEISGFGKELVELSGFDEEISGFGKEVEELSGLSEEISGFCSASPRQRVSSLTSFLSSLFAFLCICFFIQIFFIAGRPGHASTSC